MSTVFEPAIAGDFAAGNGKTVISGNGTGTAVGREFIPLGLNAQKVVAKRYSLKDENGEPLETWADIVRRVVGHVSRAETEPVKRDLFYNEMTDGHARPRVHPEHALPRQCRQAKGPARRLLRAECSRFDRGHHGARAERGDHSSDGRRHRHDI